MALLDRRFINTQEAIEYLLTKAGGSLGTPIGKTFAFSYSPSMMKSTVHSDGSVDVEGWISTPRKDIQKDVIEPESFSGDALNGYMLRGAPISVEHGTRTLPVGFLQKAMLVRDGQVIQLEDNPRHPKIAFRYFDGGTGWYGLGNIYDQKAALGVVKGTVSSFSWIGMPNIWEDLSEGGRRFSKKGAINPLLEVTLTAYPINTEATMRLAKAAGYAPKLDTQSMLELLANPVVVDAVIDILVPRGHSRTAVESVIDEYTKSFETRRKVTDYFSPKGK